MSNPLKDWKVEIPLSDFCEFVAKPVAVEPGKRNFFETKDNTSLTGHRLRARVRMTFAGLPTKNSAVYLPDEMFNGLSTWTNPYPRPVQKHHEDHVDPVGRVIDARYVDTTAHAAQLDSRIAHSMRVFKDKKATAKAKLSSVPLFQELAKQTSDYRGVGHIQGLWDISDPDAIQKVLDGRYLTVSTSFVPKGAYCSACAAEGELTDWRHSYCDHERGDTVNGATVLAIPFGFEYNEVSFVNDPAAQHAQVLEAGENISFEDAVKNVNYSVPYEIVTDPIIVVDGKGYRFSDSSNVIIPEGFNVRKNVTEKDASVIGSNEQREEKDSQRNIMKFADLIKDSKSNYLKIAEHLNSDSARLTGSLLEELEDSVFAGPNRTFPLKDEAHCEAIKTLLETVEDSDAKTDLLLVVDAKLAKLAQKEEAAAAEAAAEADEATPEAEEDVASEEEVETDAVTVAKAELDELKEKAGKVEDLEASRNILKHRIEVLEADLSALEALNSSLLKEQKEMLATQLVDAQIAKGFRVTDKTERVSKFMSRSVESLRDSLADLVGEAETGMAREPSGAKLPNPTAEQDSREADQSEEEDRSADLSAYQAILDTYYEISFGPRGQRAADQYLTKQKKLGYLPAHVNP